MTLNPTDKGVLCGAEFSSLKELINQEKRKKKASEKYRNLFYLANESKAVL